MSKPATGRIDASSTGHDIVVERTFNIPMTEVWRSIVEPECMNRWIGTWSGEAGVGKRVAFVMTAEGATEPEDALIHACDAPRLLDVESFQGETSWRMTLGLSEANGVTTLVFRQKIDRNDDASSIGPGWEYYLDRLVAVLEGAGFLDWEDYYPAQQAHWDDLARKAFST